MTIKNSIGRSVALLRLLHLGRTDQAASAAGCTLSRLWRPGGCNQVSAGVPGEGASCLFQFLGLQVFLGCGYTTLISASFFMWPSLLLSFFVFLKCLHLIISAKTFSNKATCTVSRDMALSFQRLPFSLLKLRRIRLDTAEEKISKSKAVRK